MDFLNKIGIGILSLVSTMTSYFITPNITSTTQINVLNNEGKELIVPSDLTLNQGDIVTTIQPIIQTTSVGLRVSDAIQNQNVTIKLEELQNTGVKNTVFHNRDESGSLTIITPEGGTFKTGDAQEIVWTSNGLTKSNLLVNYSDPSTFENENILITLLDSRGITFSNFPKFDMVPNNGSFKWTIPDNLKSGKYKIQITCQTCGNMNSGNGVWGESNYFNVSNQSDSQTITTVISKPMVMKISDSDKMEIKGGEEVILYGTDFTEDLKVEISPIGIGEGPGHGSMTPKFIEFSKDKISFIFSSRLVANSLPGTYDLWVSNSVGVSNKIQVNLGEFILN